MNIEATINTFAQKLHGTACRLVAVSKTKPIAQIKAAYEAGQRLFGENKVQEMADKQAQLPADIEWHMIGHLQRNKVKYIAPFVSLIHSVDSKRLLAEIDKQAGKCGRVINVLLQVHIAKEDTKFGLSEEELYELLQDPALSDLKQVRIIGLMGMATFTDNREQIRAEFKGLKTLFDQLSRQTTADNVEMTELSMGMSSDYTLGIEEGATLIRVGSTVFGAREYKP